jgi:glycosyltransferase involved in cell wall biosynthesis/hydroxymethylpyrimidine pyrophosphatase-like HAD family hydrolase
MKIYYASQSFYPHIGGVSTYLLNLAKEMVRKGNDVVEVHLRPQHEEHEDEIKGIEIHRVPREPIDNKIMEGYGKFKETVYKECHENVREFTKPPAEIEGFEEFNEVNTYFGEQLNELLEEDKADVVHIHDFQLLFAYKYVPRGTPCILTWHIPFIPNMSHELSSFLVRHMNEYDKIVFSSPEYIEAAVDAGIKREKTELIYPMANTSIFRKLDVDKEKVKEKLGIEKDKKIILCVQRVDPKSGHEQLIRAMPKILEKVPEAVLVFVGGDSMSNKLSKSRQALKENILTLIEELKIHDKVIWTGTIDYYDLPEVYNSAEVNCLCSKNEGFGLAVTEGMACGLPIVGTRVGGIPIQVKNNYNGFLVEVGDVEATADRISKILLDSKLKETFSNNSIEMVEKEFLIERGIEKHLMLYTKVIKLKDEFHRLEFIDPAKIKAIITDLDRTITDGPAKRTFDQNDFDRDLIKEMKSLNKDFFLATGRSVKYVKGLCKKFKIWRAIIAENGAVIYFPSTKKTITINTEYMKKAKKIIRAMNIEGVTIGKVIASINEKDEEKVMLVLKEMEDHLTFEKNADEIMITPKGVEKGLGVRIAMQYLNIDLDDTMVIGDGENDVSMFLNPGFKIALANANEKLKKLANHTTMSPSVNGMKEIITELKRE